MKCWVGLGRFIHVSSQPAAAGQAQDMESSPAKYRRSTTVVHNQWCIINDTKCSTTSVPTGCGDWVVISGNNIPDFSINHAIIPTLKMPGYNCPPSVSVEKCQYHTILFNFYLMSWRHETICNVMMAAYLVLQWLLLCPWLQSNYVP